MSGWAGDFDCSKCRRKRLTASEFSNTQLAKKRKDDTFLLKCKKCADEEADALVTSLSSASLASDGDPAVHPCSACLQPLPAAAFNKNQLFKGPGKQRCVACVTASIRAEAKAVEAKKQEKLLELRDKADKAGSGVDKVLAAAEECAKEAQLVTGLKPVKLGRGRGRGTWRGRGRAK